MKKIFFLAFLITSINATASNKIKAYFNHPVDTSVSTTIPAVYLNHCLHDTIIAYINRAKYSLDIALYNYSQGAYDTIAYAVNNAYSRGVNVRWIYDGSSSNSGLNYLVSGIHTLASPTTGSYTLMHNKFVIIDAISSDPLDPIVISGSCNWTSQQFFTDYNNTIILQDSALSQAYTAEFNMMWGGSGLTPDTALSKFGSHKTNLGMHNFIIDGKSVELYFSPSDSTNSHIQATIDSANTDLYFGMYSFTDSTDASLILARHAAGVYVSGISDTTSATYAPDSMFRSALGSQYQCYTGTGLYHSKYLIVDQANKCADPTVLTGSHNWSAVANTHNDENTLIIHDDTLANVYFQFFYASFLASGGTLTAPAGCTTHQADISDITDDVKIYPNPTQREVTVTLLLKSAGNVSVEVYDMIGQKTEAANWSAEAGANHKTLRIGKPGVYFVFTTIGNKVTTSKLLVE